MTGIGGPRIIIGHNDTIVTRGKNLLHVSCLVTY